MKFNIIKIESTVEVEAHFIYGKRYTKSDHSPAFIHFVIEGNIVNLKGFSCRSRKVIYCGSEMITDSHVKKSIQNIAENAMKQINTSLLPLLKD